MKFGKQKAIGALIALGLGAMMTASAETASVTEASFGKTTEGKAVKLYTLTNANGLVAKITNYGGILTELHVPDRDGKMGDVVLGFDNLGQYLKGHPFFGATVGRVANRIAKGRFTLDGEDYKLAVNNGPNHLHGGIKGFDKLVWKAKGSNGKNGPSLKLSLTSPDGDEGYPGKLDVTVVYTLTNTNSLKIEYTAQTNKATPINLTNHSYFNLAGSGLIIGHELLINGDHYIPTDDTLIPTGKIENVKGTPFDFTTSHQMGDHIAEVSGTPVGYDLSYVINPERTTRKLACKIYEPLSGREMTMYTTEPGFQYYTGNFLDGSLTGKYGNVYAFHTGFCLEAGHFPDSINHPSFPSSVLRPDQTYRQTTEYVFSKR